MQKTLVSMVAALGKHTRAIGKDNDLLWKIPDDLKRFKELTSGHPIIMGRKTFDSIGRVLPNRTNIVVTRNSEWQYEDVEVFRSLEDALERGREIDSTEVFVIGGGELYKQALPFADKLYLTLVDDDAPGTVFFPEYEKEFPVVLKREDHVYDKLHYEWVTYTR